MAIAWSYAPLRKACSQNSELPWNLAHVRNSGKVYAVVAAQIDLQEEQGGGKLGGWDSAEKCAILHRYFVRPGTGASLPRAPRSAKRELKPCPFRINYREGLARGRLLALAVEARHDEQARLVRLRRLEASQHRGPGVRVASGLSTRIWCLWHRIGLRAKARKGRGSAASLLSASRMLVRSGDCGRIRLSRVPSDPAVTIG